MENNALYFKFDDPPLFLNFSQLKLGNFLNFQWPPRPLLGTFPKVQRFLILKAPLRIYTLIFNIKPTRQKIGTLSKLSFVCLHHIVRRVTHLMVFVFSLTLLLQTTKDKP